MATREREVSGRTTPVAAERAAATVGRRAPRRPGRRAGLLTRLPRTPLRRVALCLAVLVAFEAPLHSLAALPRPAAAAAPAAVAPGFLSGLVTGLGAALASLGSSLLEVDAGGASGARGRAVATILEVGGAEVIRSADTGLQEATGPGSFDASAEETEVPVSPLLEVVSGKSRTFGCASPTGCPDGTPPDGLPLADVPDELENEVFALSRAGSALAKLLPGGVAPGVAALDAVVAGSFAGVRCNDQTRALELIAPGGEAGASRIDAVVIGGTPVELPGEVEPNTTIATSDAPLVVLNEQRCGVDEATRTASCTTNALSAELPGAARLTLSSSFAEIVVPEECELCVPILTSSIKTGAVIDRDRVGFIVRVESSGCGAASDVVVIDRVPSGAVVDLPTVTIDGVAAPEGAVTLGPCPDDVSFDGCAEQAPVDTGRECLTIEAGDLAAFAAIEVTFEATVDPARCEAICNTTEIEAAGTSGSVSVSRTALVAAPLAGVDDDGDGFSVCDGDCDDLDSSRNPEAAEVCDGEDQDCDGSADEDLGDTTCGFGVCLNTVENCVDGETQTCDPFAGAGTESCNGLDDDCDGATDEGFGQTTCGTGACQVMVDDCLGGALQVCTPGQPTQETCGNAVDDDCDGSVDEQDVCGGGGVPPDPSTIAPPFEGGVATNVADSTEFLYTGPNPIQTGVAPGTIEARRAAVVRGKVLDRSGAAISGVEITILDHPEFGQTLSRADGAFDMAVNGGGLLAIDYRGSGFLPAQRQVDVPWQDYVVVPDVVLIPKDPQVTTIDMNSPAPMQVAQGSVMSDADGTRQATLFVPAGTGAELVMPDGTTQPASTLNIRLTEYTVGPEGPSTMPGPLPPTSGYTYAVEIGADEAVAKKDGKDVLLSQPVFFYLENFLDFPTGMIVPVGFYDNDRAAWVPSENGRVIEITGVTNGHADVETVGGGSEPALTLSDAEREQLANQYSVGQTLWRVPITHFSTWDCNWPFGPPPDATEPDVPDPDTDDLEDQCLAELPVSSVIECQNQILGETIRVVGTPFALDYRSGRVPGRVATRTLDIHLSGPSVPGSLKRIDLRVQIAGRTFPRSFPALPNQSTTFTWDGKDAYGRTLNGIQRVSGRIGFVYDAVFTNPVSLERAFGMFGEGIARNRGRGEITIFQPFEDSLGSLDAQDFGGWTLSAHHGYDPAGSVVHLGNGRRQGGETVGQIIIRVAGTSRGFSGDGGLATSARLNEPLAVAVGPDGSIFISDTNNVRIRRVAPDGTITTVAGTGSFGFSGDGGPATQARLATPRGLALGPDGSLFIADSQNHRVRRVGLDGVITTVAGTGTAGFSGDGGPAIQAQLSGPVGVAVSPDGSFFIAGNNRVRRVAPDGTITTIAGTGAFAFGGDGGAATQARLASPIGLAFGPDGSLYIGDFNNNRVRRVTSDGIITTVAGGGSTLGDGGPATQATLATPEHLGVGRDGSLFIAEALGARIRRVTPDGIINTVAGGVGAGPGGDGGPARRAALSSLVRGLAVGPDGSVVIADSNNHRIRRVSPQLPGFSGTDLAVASQDGALLYRFSDAGRHLRSLDTLTGATLYEFGYDAGGRLTEIRDGDGNVTTIQRDGSGNPTAITGPFGQQTTLGVDANGFLNRVTNPAGETFAMTYTADGLLESVTDPRGNTSSYQYDGLGRLTRTDDPAGGSHALTRTELVNGHEVTKTTALGRTSTYRVENLPTGDRRLTNTAPDGTVTKVDLKQDGTQIAQLPGGALSTTVLGPDPRFGMQAPLVASSTVQNQSGLTFSSAVTRTVALTNPADPLSLARLTELLRNNGKTVFREYSRESNTVTKITPEGRRLVTTLDALGRIIRLEVPGVAPNTFTYDSRGLLTSVTSGSGSSARTVLFVNNAEGLPETAMDPLGRITRFVYDSANRVTGRILPDGRTIETAYDAAGNLSSLTPPGRPAHTFGHSARNELTSTIPPNIPGTGPTTYDYDFDGALRGFSTPDDETMTIQSDAAGRPIARILAANGITVATDTLSYDAEGRVLRHAAASGITGTFTYDSLLHTGESWSGPITGSVAHAFDSGRRVTRRTVNGSDPLEFIYDDDDLLIQAGDLAISRDPASGLVMATSLGDVSTGTTYNEFAEPSDHTANVGASAIYAAAFTRDRVGRIVAKAETVGGVTDHYVYTYAEAGRLITVVKNGGTVESYDYDSNGNRTRSTLNGITETASHDDHDRLIQYGSTTYTYNAAGDLLRRSKGAAVTDYDYDVLGNLVAVTLPNGDSINYLVDGAGRRLGKKVNGTLVQEFLYDGPLRPVAELDGGGTVVSRFVYANGHVPAYMMKGGSSFRILTDQVGSVRLVVDSSTGETAQRIDYDSFGNVLHDSNPGFQPFGFAGGLYDPDTGLVRFGSRDYDAETGRWTAKDPNRFAGGDTNLYAYVANDPVNRIDPTGRAIAIVVIAVGLAIFAAGFVALIDLVANIEHDANEEARQTFTANDFPDPSRDRMIFRDCYRHCFGSCMAQARYGAFAEWGIDNLRENDTPGSRQDVLNNEVGQRICDVHDLTSLDDAARDICAAECLTAFVEGNLMCVYE